MPPSIPDLPETLGVVPLLHLIPKQDLAPLLSFSRLEPGGIDNSSVVSHASLAVALDILRAQENGVAEASQLMDDFLSQFASFEAPEESRLRFRKPVISSQSVRTVTPHHLPPLLRQIYETQTPVDDSSLADFEVDLDVSAVLNDHLRLLPTYADLEDEAASQHVAHYKHKFQEERHKMLKKRHRGPVLWSDKPAFARKKMHVEAERDDSVIASLYRLVDSIYYAGNEPPEREYSLHDVCLSSTSATQLYSALSRLTTSSKLAEINATYLRQVATLAVNTLNAEKEKALKLDSPSLSLLLTSSKILFLIINVNTNDRKLHLDYYVESSVDMLKCLVHGFVSGQSDLSALSDLPNLIQHITDCTQSLVEYLTRNKADELTLTKVEFMSIEAIFTELDGDLHTQLRSVMILLLTQTFKFYPSQRQFIVNEMLTNFKRLSPQKTSTHRMKISNGGNVLFFSIFLIRLVQSFDAKSLSKDISAFGGLEKSNNPHSAINIKRQSILRGATAILEESKHLAAQISSFFAESLVKADSSYKLLFQTFLDDVVALLSAPNWPGAKVVAESLMVTFSLHLETNKFQGPMEPYALEVVGKIGIEILKLRHQCSSRISTSIVSLSALNTLSAQLESALSQVPDDNHQVLHFTVLNILKIYECILNRLSPATQEQIFAVNPENNLPSKLPEAVIKLHSLIDNIFPMLNKDSEMKATNNYVSPGDDFYLAMLLYDLDPLFDNFISLLVSYLESSKAKLMAKAIKLLSPMIDTDPNILLALRISKSISKTMNGNSPLVKDAIIDILGKYVSTNPDLIQRYYKDICERSGDDSISVRKRVTKLMKDMYTLLDDEVVQIFISKKFLRRLEDEENSIADLARNSLTALWFEEQVIHSPKKVCRIMVEIANSAGFNPKTFMKYLSKAAADSGVKKYLKDLVSLSFGMILDHVETDPLYAAKVLVFINLSSKCDTNLVTFEDLVFLEPYLIAEQAHYADICWYSLQIFRTFLKDYRNFRKGYIIKVRDALLSRLTKFDVRELHEAVPIIEILSHKITDSTKWVNAFLATIVFIKPMANQGKMSILNLAKCRKLLHLLGCFGSYCSLEHEREVVMKNKIGLKANETVVSLISRYLLAFCQKKFDQSVRKVAFKNLLCISTYHPKLLMSGSILLVMDLEFESGPHDIKLAIVEGLSKFLAKEDEDVVLQKSSQNSKLKIEVFQGESAPSMNDGICANIIQRYMDKILSLCLLDHSAFSPVLFLQLVVKLGYANPKMCISTIIALEASSNKAIKKIATCLHVEIFERHESLADRNYPEAIRLAVEYSKTVEGRSFLREFLFLRSVYRVISKQYLSKKKFVLSLAKLFQISLTSSSLEECIRQRDVIVFVSMNILVLSLSSLEEVCLLLFHLDRTITRDGFDLADKITKTMRSNTGSGMSMDNLQILFVNSQCVLALIYLRRLLAASYSISSSVIEEFRPSRSDLELRQSPRAINLIDFPLEELEMSNKLVDPQTFGKIFSKYVLMINDYST